VPVDVVAVHRIQPPLGDFGILSHFSSLADVWCRVGALADEQCNMQLRNACSPNEDVGRPNQHL
jgi:hypothetical protein